MHITTKQIIPATGLAAVLISALASVALKWVLLIAVIEACIVLALDPYSLLERRLAPVSRAMIITATALTMIGLYWLMWLSIPALLISLLVAGLLVGLTVRYNGQWVADYLFFASSNLKQALVSVGDLPHLKAWDKDGRRECDTMLREYLHITAQPAELDTLYRSVYALGYVRAYQHMDKKLDRQIERYNRLADKYNALTEQSVSVNDYNKLADELASWQDEVTEIRELWASDTSNSRYWHNEYNKLAEAYAVLRGEIEALEDELEDIEDIELEDKEQADIMRLPTTEERIRADRAEGMSYNALATKYGKTKSQIQYICNKGVAV